MFHINYETARAEVARRHERLHAAQRSGIAFEPRKRRANIWTTVTGWIGRKSSAPASTPVTTSGDPCLTC